MLQVVAVGEHWKQTKRYDLRLIDLAPMVYAGEVVWPEGTEILTSKVPDAWDEISESDPVVREVHQLTLVAYTFDDMGLPTAVKNALIGAGYNRTLGFGGR